MGHATSHAGPERIGRWVLAIPLLSLVICAISTLTLPWNESLAMVNGVVLSGSRMELARFLREPHECPVVAATTDCRELALALRDLEAQVVGLPFPEGNAESWLGELRRQGVTHVVLCKDLPENSARGECESAIAGIVAASPEQYDLIWDGRWIEVYEVVR